MHHGALGVHEGLEIGVWCVVPLVLHPETGRWPSNSGVLKNQSNRSLAIPLLAGVGVVGSGGGNRRLYVSGVYRVGSHINCPPRNEGAIQMRFHVVLG